MSNRKMLTDHIRVYVFPFPERTAELTLPPGAVIFRVGAVAGIPAIWVREPTTPDDEPNIDRRLHILRDGDHLSSAWWHLGTVEIADTLTFHIFEEPPDE